MTRHRIAIAGFRIESSTFSMLRAGDDTFGYLRGQELLDHFQLDRVLGERMPDIEWRPVLRAAAGAGGPVLPETFDAIVREIVDGIAAGGTLDGVYLDLHGASHVEGRTAAEEHLVERIRSVVGDDAVISISMDPHGNLSEHLASLVDLAACHRHSPHIDARDTYDRAIRNLVEVLDRGVKPVKAWVRVPILLPGERTSTTVEPGRSVFGAALPAIERFDVFDANVWVGFAWADEARNAGAVLVTSWDADAAVACASDLAERYWAARKDFALVADHTGSWADALDFAITRPAFPLWISDSGDNVTAGASGDTTFALRATLDRPDVLSAGLRILFTGLVDPAAVAAAAAAGPGAVLDRAIGAAIDDRYGAPVGGAWRVVSVEPDWAHGGTGAAILDNGTVHVAVHIAGTKFAAPDDPTLLPRRGQAWYDMSAYDVVVVKNGYLFPSQAALAATWFMALTPGATDLELDRLDFQRISRPLYGFGADDFDADLAPALLPIVGGRSTAEDAS
jgi:microcystin degradation protein MlrC